MSREKKQRDPFVEGVVGCLGFLILMFLITTIVTWVTPP